MFYTNIQSSRNLAYYNHHYHQNPKMALQFCFTKMVENKHTYVFNALCS